MPTVTKAGRYEIVGELGRGAMGVVYKAMDPVIGRAVAVKTIRLSEEGTGLSRPELLTRFQTEARAAGLLTHPNIVVVFDAGEEDGLYYITMELVEGKSLQALLDDGHAFPLPRTLRIMEQTCSALQFAHERNVIHRDIKPANLMLTADDTVKVTDFGTAKILQFGTVQQTAHVMGTPSYMSPEQVKGRAVDGRSDIFSLGVMLYEMVTGEKPFPGQNITTVIYKIVNEEPVPPRQIDPSIHPGISAVVMKALAKEPEQRYQSCREMLEDLRNYRAQGAAGGNANSTLVMGGSSPAATIATGNAGGRGLVGHNPVEDDPTVIATARSLSARAASPGQTPVVRRTGTIAPPPEPVEPPKKKSIVGTIFAALLLLAVIVYGANKMKPVFEAARALHNSQVKESQSGKSAGAATGTTPDSSGANPPAIDASQGSNEAATALLHGPAGQVLSRCETPCSFNNLRPESYSLEVKKEGYQPVQTALQIKGGEAQDQKIKLESLAKGIFISTQPPGADVFINGAKQSGQTPVTLPLAPGQYNLVLRLQGYEPYAGPIQVKDNIQTQFPVVLTEKSKIRDAWSQVNSNPKGAEIIVDGASTGQFTPSRVQVPAGTHTITLRLNGFQQAKKMFQVSEGGTVNIDESLREK